MLYTGNITDDIVGISCDSMTKEVSNIMDKWFALAEKYIEKFNTGIAPVVAEALVQDILKTKDFVEYSTDYGPMNLKTVITRALIISERMLFDESPVVRLYMRDILGWMETADNTNYSFNKYLLVRFGSGTNNLERQQEALKMVGKSYAESMMMYVRPGRIYPDDSSEFGYICSRNEMIDYLLEGNNNSTREHYTDFRECIASLQWSIDEATRINNKKIISFNKDRSSAY